MVLFEWVSKIRLIYLLKLPSKISVKLHSFFDMFDPGILVLFKGRPKFFSELSEILPREISVILGKARVMAALIFNSM